LILRFLLFLDFERASFFFTVPQNDMILIVVYDQI
jgi:hypothetical protein